MKSVDQFEERPQSALRVDSCRLGAPAKFESDGYEADHGLEGIGAAQGTEGLASFVESFRGKGEASLSKSGVFSKMGGNRM